MTGQPERRPYSLDRDSRLTPRESEVVGWMSRGYTNAGIAKQLYVSTKTVEVHVARIYDKLEVHDERDTNRRVLAVLRWLEQQRQA
jgi:DNA-binding NarL/FixJ family response regulator